MAAKYWQAEEKRDAINLPFLMSTEVKNKFSRNFIANSLLCGAIFYFNTMLYVNHRAGDVGQKPPGILSLCIRPGGKIQ